MGSYCSKSKDSVVEKYKISYIIHKKFDYTVLYMLSEEIMNIFKPDDILAMYISVDSDNKHSKYGSTIYVNQDEQILIEIDRIENLPDDLYVENEKHIILKYLNTLLENSSKVPGNLMYQAI